MSSTILGVGSRVKHPAYGDGVVVGLEQIAYKVAFMVHGIKHVSKEYKEWEIIEALPSDNDLTITEVEKSLTKVLRRWSNVSELVDLGDKWDGGAMILKPGDDSLKSKEIPIDTFFHKIVMLRDRLRVMEQRINSSGNLSDEEKVNLQQYLTRIYGSLTTFNVLFKYKDDHFKGEKSK
jgi:hypothetical protein